MFDNTTAGKMLLGIAFVVSKQYSDQLSDNVKRGIRRSLEKGKYLHKGKHGYYKDNNQLLGRMAIIKAFSKSPGARDWKESRWMKSQST